MEGIRRSQIRGARGLLDWSLVDLAKAAGVSVSSVKRAETDGTATMSSAALGQIVDALQEAGVRFLPDEGDGPGLRLQRRRAVRLAGLN